MMVVMLVAGIGLVLAGLLAIGFGFPVKEFSFGNTLILTGVMAVCTGAIMLALWMAVRELKTIARWLGAGVAQPRADVAIRPVLPPGAWREPAPADGGFLFNRDQQAAENATSPEPAAASAPSPPPWQDEAASRDRPRSDAAPEVAPAAAAWRCQTGAICCFPRRRGRSASGRRREPASRCRRICCRRTFVPTAPHRRRPSPSRRSPHRSTMPGRNRNGQGPVTLSRSGAVPGHPRPSTRPMAPRREMKISRR